MMEDKWIYVGLFSLDNIKVMELVHDLIIEDPGKYRVQYQIKIHHDNNISVYRMKAKLIEGENNG